MENQIMDPGENHRRYEEEVNKVWKWASEAHRLTQEGDLDTSLHYINLCLSNPAMREVANDVGNPEEFITNSNRIDHQLSSSELLSLLEKRCWIHLKLRHFDKAIQDAQSLLQLQNNHPLAFKCLLAALCKLNQLDKVPEILKVWKVASPNNLEMIETRTKLEGLMEAVSHGIESRSAFSDVEDKLGLNGNGLLKNTTSWRWKHRPIPPGRNAFVLCLQYRFGHCSLGQKCPDAHGQAELEEWKERYSLEGDRIHETPRSVRNPSIIQSLLDRMGNVGDESVVSSDDSGSHGIKIKPLGPLKVTLSSRKMKPYQWKFAVESKQPLVSICLLHEIHRQYFRISSAFRHESGSRFNLKPLDADEIPLQALEIKDEEEETMCRELKAPTYVYSFEILFSPELLGNFRQTIVFDFGFDPKPIKNISIEVYPPGEDEETDGTDASIIKNGHSVSPTEEEVFVTRRKCTWNYGNAEIVNGANGSRVPCEKIGFALLNGMIKSSVVGDAKEHLTRENYKEKMRFFLTEEERARQEIISKYNVSAVLKILDTYQMTSGYFDGESKYAVDGGLFGRLTLFRDISEDTAVGRLILRSCNCVLLTKTEDAQDESVKPRVYWCEISDKTKNAIYIQMGRTCVRELALKSGDTFLFDIQFQLDRTAFMEQKKVIDRLSSIHLDMLFPDFNRPYHIPWSPVMQWDPSEKANSRRLNPKQKESLIAISSESSRVPPILLIGPFGTGKTFTLAQCIRRILQQPSSRIMICTQSNSAADLYIKEYLDLWVEEGFQAARPLRIYYALRSFKTVHPNVLKYCIIEHSRFRNPTKEDILAHRVVVVTLGTSYMLMDLELPHDTFSHIFLDEAAQAMESEAITPLMSAGENTKLVLAGDHMQLSPELFCEQAKNFHSSLLERLHCHYPESHPCKLMLCENYRSHAAIIQFASEAFYNKKLECGMSQPVHENIYPLSFFAARGEDVQEADSTSYFNMAEVFEVTEKVSEIISSWPESWGDYKDESAIGVLTPYADQVSKLRARLRKKGLTHVSVERVLNVQGKQFRVVFLSTVRTHKPWVQILPEAVGKEVDLGFFSNPKLLNTALTRAQSLVAVVGDPVSLCTVGKCRVLWEDFIRVCHENKSIHGISYMQLKQNILGVEMRLTWGLNPLANEFKPKSNAARSSSSLPQSAAMMSSASHLKPNIGTSAANHFYPQSRHSPVATSPADVGAATASQLHGAYLTTGSHPSGPVLQSPYQHSAPPSALQNSHLNQYQVLNPQYGYCALPMNPPPPPPQQQQMIRQYGLPFPNFTAVSPVMPAVDPRFVNMMVQPAAGSPYFAPVALPQVQSREAFHPYTQGIGPQQQQQQQQRYTGTSSVAPPVVAPFTSYASDMSQHNQQWNRDVIHPYQSNYSSQQVPLAKPFAGDIPRYPSPVNAQHAAGLPLYRRPAESSSANSSNFHSHAPQAQNAIAKLSSSNLDKLSTDEITILKDVLEKFSNHRTGDPAMGEETMKSLYSKFGLSVSDAFNYSPSSVGSGNNPSVAPPTEINLPEHQRRRPHTTLDNPIAVACGNTNPVKNNLMFTNQHQRVSVIPPFHSAGSSVQVVSQSNNWFSNSGNYMNSFNNEEAKVGQSNTNSVNSTPNLHSFPSSQGFRGLSSQNYLSHHHSNETNGFIGYSHTSEGRNHQDQGSNSSGNPAGGHRSYANVVKQAPTMTVGTSVNNNISQEQKNQQYVALLPKLKQQNSDRIQLSKLCTSKQSTLTLQDISMLNNYGSNSVRNSNR